MCRPPLFILSPNKNRTKCIVCWVHNLLFAKVRCMQLYFLSHSKRSGDIVGKRNKSVNDYYVDASEMHRTKTSAHLCVCK